MLDYGRFLYVSLSGNQGGFARDLHSPQSFVGWYLGALENIMVLLYLVIFQSRA